VTANLIEHVGTRQRDSAVFIFKNVHNGAPYNRAANTRF